MATQLGNSDSNTIQEGTSGETLRQQAERKVAAQRAEDSYKQSHTDIERTLYELEVHQIELELQNEELRLAQEALIASQARYFELYDLAPVGYLTLSAQYLILEANLEAARLLGVPRSALIGRPFAAFVHSRDQDALYLSFRRSQSATVLQTLRLRLSTGGSEAEPVWMQLELNTVQAPTGDSSPVAYRAVLTDITASKRAEELLETTTALMREAQAVTHVGHWIWHLRTNRLEWSDEVYRIVGVEPETFDASLAAGKRVIHPDDLPAVLQARSRLLEEQQPITVEHRIVRPGGEVRTVVVRAGVMQIEDEAIVSVFGTVQDVTERNAAEAALRESKAHFERIAAAVPGVLFDYLVHPDDRGELLYLSPVVQELLELEPATVMNDLNRFWQLVHPDDLKTVKLTPFVVDDVGPVIKVEMRITTPSGRSKWIDCIARAHVTPQGEEVLWSGFAHDITERRQAEHERTQLQLKLAQAQKMELVGRLAGGVAHGFNNLLAVITMRTELAYPLVEPGTRLHRHLVEIDQASHRAAELTRQLLGFARQQMVTPVVFDLNAKVRSMLSMLRQLIGEEIQLIWLPIPDQCKVRIDPAQISQILISLCVNARDAKASTITVATENVTLTGGSWHGQPAILPGEYVVLAVRDNGEGMNKASMEHIFEPFFTTKEVGKGTGLGLPTIYGIVQQNHGQIHVQSEPGRGTAFFIYLPRLPDDAAITAQAMHGALPRGHGETVLVVEDEPTVLKMAAESLEELGYHVLTAATPGAAIQLFTTQSVTIHLLVTDLVLPGGMNGYELAAQLTRLQPSLRRLYLSGYPPDHVARGGVVGEDGSFLRKPFSLSQLATFVRDALDSPQ